MTKILITGKDSYIGTNVKIKLLRNNDDYLVEELDMKNPNWEEFDFSTYDVILHVAGIAHVSTKKKLDNLYFSVNRDLAIKTALKAKNEGVKQFIFMSSIIIYGEKINNGYIEINKFNPSNAYGKSKLEADIFINNLNNKNFHSVIIRTPVVYGKNSKGNFAKLLNFSKKMPIIFDIQAERSMIYIENLAEFIKLIIDNKSSGVYYPQNQDYVNIRDTMEQIRIIENKRFYRTKLFNPIIFFFSCLISPIKKMYATKKYNKEISIHFDNNYNLVNFQESIRRILSKEEDE